MSEGWDVGRAATALLEAESSRVARDSFAAEWPQLDLGTAYAIQGEVLRRKHLRGECTVGVKLGLTSRAKQQRMNVASPLTGWLTDAMLLPGGMPVPVEEMLHPRVEPEIVFVMRDRLAGPGVSAATALAAVGSVWAGVEVIDSRYRDFRFTLADVVADNASAGCFALGPRGLPPDELDLAMEACVLQVDGKVVDSATGAAVLHHPAEALAWAANDLAARGLAIEAGWVVLTGGMTDAMPLAAGTRVTAAFTRLGDVVITGG